MKYTVLVSDPPYEFDDKLRHNPNIKRGAEDNYQGVLTVDKLKQLPIEKISEDTSVLALWCPSAVLPSGLDIINSWGFEYKQTWIWVKTKQNPLVELIKKFKKDKLTIDDIINFNLNSILDFNMGSIFRNTHEVALIGTRGKASSMRENKSQRTVFIYKSLSEHSQKPEGLQDQLDLMFPHGNRLEMFARRQRKNYVCFGNESLMTPDEDVFKSINKLINIKEDKFNVLKELIGHDKMSDIQIDDLVCLWDDIPSDENVAA